MMRAKSKGGALAALLMVLLLVLSMTAPGGAARPPDRGGGPPEGKGNGKNDTGDIYADLVLALRYESGLPILEPFTVEGETGTVTEYCVQPVSYDPVPGITTTVENPVNGADVWRIPLMGELPPPEDPEVEVEVCDPQPAYAPFVQEVDLERLNLGRTDDAVLESKLVEIAARLSAAQVISLDGAGRITTDGAAMDASPEYAAIFKSIMDTGKIPGLDAFPAEIEIFDAWDLAAAAIGTASGKEVPINVDTVEYYLRVMGVPAGDVDGDDWVLPTLSQTGSTEEFVNFSSFSYNRDATFTGCTTRLDESTYPWELGVYDVQDAVGFADLPDVADEFGTVHNVAGFAQLADDARAAILYMHENETTPGFFMDAVGENTCDAQGAALTGASVDFVSLPANVMQNEPFAVAASVRNGPAAAPIASAYVQLTVDATDPFTAADQVTAVDRLTGQPIVFALETDGDLVGRLGAASGFPVPAGYDVTTTLDVLVANGAPVGTYTLGLDLVDVSTGSVATDSAAIEVAAGAPTATWLSVPTTVTQAVAAPLSGRAFNGTPDTLIGAALALRVHAPEAFTNAGTSVLFIDGVTVKFSLDQVTGDLVAPLWSGDLASGAEVGTAPLLFLGSDAPLGQYTLTLELSAPTLTDTVTDDATTTVLQAEEGGGPPDGKGGGPPDGNGGGGGKR